MTGINEKALLAAFRVNHHTEAEPSSVELAALRRSIATYVSALDVPAHPEGVKDAREVLQRLIGRLEYFHNAPDDADVWVGGWSIPQATAVLGTVKAGEIRAALAGFNEQKA